MPRRELYTIGSMRGSRMQTRRVGSLVKHPLWRSMGALGDAASAAADQQQTAEALQSFTPTQGKSAAVAAFQAAWNEGPLSGSGITVDGEYGGNTQAALQQVYSHFGDGGPAPANAYGDPVPSVPTVTPGGGTPPPLPTPAPNVPPAPLVEKDDSTGWILPVAIGGAAVVGLVWLLKRRKGKRPLLEVRTNPMRRRRAA